MHEVMKARQHNIDSKCSENKEKKYGCRARAAKKMTDVETKCSH